MAELTREERRWIASLKRVCSKRPPTLGLWAGTGDLLVIALAEDGGLLHGDDFGVAGVGTIRIPAGGGDPNYVDFDELERPWIAGAREESGDV
jgi:hypothetical protein